jgi:hypothetical protein
VVVIHQGRYDYAQLLAFRELATHHVMGMTGVWGIGIDVRDNAVALRVDHESAQVAVVDSLGKLGVPRSAIRVSG